MVSSPATMRARRSALGSDNTSTFSAPRASIANQVPIPTGPAPATSAVPPARTPLRDTACQPTAIGSTSAPLRRSTPSGTPSPTSTTVPENSNSTTTVQVTAAPAPPRPDPRTLPPRLRGSDQLQRRRHHQHHQHLRAQGQVPHEAPPALGTVAVASRRPTPGRGTGLLRAPPRRNRGVQRQPYGCGRPRPGPRDALAHPVQRGFPLSALEAAHRRQPRRRSLDGLTEEIAGQDDEYGGDVVGVGSAGAEMVVQEAHCVWSVLHDHTRAHQHHVTP